MATGEEQVIVRLVAEVDKYVVSDEPLELPAKLTRYGLSELVNHLLGQQPPVPFDFLADGELLRTSLHKFMQLRSLNGEATLELRYFPLVREPEKVTEHVHADWISALASRRSDGAILTGSYDGVARLFSAVDLANPSDPVHALCVFDAHPSPLKCVSFVESGANLGSSADGTLAVLATGSLDGGLRVWLASGDGRASCVCVCAAHEGSVEALSSFSAPGSGVVQLASGSRDGTVCVWDASEKVGEYRKSLDAPARKIQVKEFVDGKKRRKASAASSEEAAERVAPPPAHLSPVSVLRAHSQPVTGVQWAGSETLVSSSWDGAMHVWDVRTAQRTHTVGGLKAIQSFALSSASESGAVQMPASLLAATGHDNGAVQLWDVRAKPSEAAAAKLLSHSTWVSALAFSETSEFLLLSASHDQTVKMWDIRGKLPLHSLDVHTDKVLAACWGGTDGGAIISGGADARLLVHALPSS
ncbi:WD40-repeat-containing domain protein [Pavlovales sp. CCMP2436]|nr:WD40-repeat-containing domain protein [Pavlovales sp. CCMP2436]